MIFSLHSKMYLAFFIFALPIFAMEPLKEPATMEASQDQRDEALKKQLTYYQEAAFYNKTEMPIERFNTWLESKEPLPDDVIKALMEHRAQLSSVLEPNGFDPSFMYRLHRPRFLIEYVRSLKHMDINEQREFIDELIMVHGTKAFEQEYFKKYNDTPPSRTSESY